MFLEMCKFVDRNSSGMSKVGSIFRMLDVK